MSFKIGDRVWMASFDRRSYEVQCPDCMGNKRLKVTLGDGTEVMVECAGCQSGYDPPRGVITQWAWTEKAEQVTVTAVTEKLNEPTEYRFAEGWFDSDGRTFATEAEAVARAAQMKMKHELEENARLMSRTKDGRSWAWNATYHRECVKRAEKDLEYHRAKLTICQAKAKS